MGMLKFEVPHTLSREEAKKRIEQLVRYWNSKYGVAASWSGDSAQLSGKVMGIQLNASLSVDDNRVGGEANDPGLLLREPAKRYLNKKFTAYLDPMKSVADLEREQD